MSEPEESAESSRDTPPPPGVEERAPHELVLILAGLAASGCAAASIVGSLEGWTSPTLGVVFATGLVEGLVAVGLAVRVLLLEQKRLALFVPGAVLAGLALSSLAAIFTLSGSV